MLEKVKITKEHKGILLKAVLIAKENGFQINDVFFTDMEVEDRLFSEMKNYYNVIFDHEFAKCLWSDHYLEFEGENISESAEVDLVKTLDMGNHPVAGLINNKRTIRIPMWQYHLMQMTMSEDPLMYIALMMEENQKK